MAAGKLKSFTLSEMIVVMIITAIVVGMAFSVLRIVQKQIHTIQSNFEKTSTLALFEQKLWQDFNEPHMIIYDKAKQLLIMTSEIDTITYSFQENFSLRNLDTIKLKITPNKAFLRGKEISNGQIDALSIYAETELPDYRIFVSKKNDLTFFMNQENGI
ncbi:pilin/secretion family protein with methylation motif [Flavobacterium cutihirudinis]|uniref:Pilin/secretion family protein with methylation motif n=1 Tax=Flavobacterium cutihirudinis TaxID=1265740 RepID=A0A3D9FYQ2_9FLAO|nr:prepilin-type N-terminal cleavage/methylation domain-containing protein [Flavobacterium cutihirudinis]RED26116.1 pilin/secretion family protein with methylation motif [Flavobacterium cutihirudinis]